MYRFVILVFVFPFFVLAQPEKKDWMVGGAGNLSSHNNIYARVYVDLNPNVAYLVNNKLALGLGLNYSSYFYRDGLSNKIFANDINTELNTLARYYFGKNRLRVPITAKVGGGSYWESRENLYGYTQIRQSLLVSFESGIGIAYFINNNISIEFTGYLKYISNKMIFNISRPRDFSIMNEMYPGFNIGFQIFLRKKKEENILKN